MPEYVLTEDGRVLDFGPWFSGSIVMELIDGAWVSGKAPVSADDHFNARVLEAEDLSLYGIKSDDEINSSL